MQKADAIILAAGRGTRMKSSLPKVLNVLAGKPLIYYSLDVFKNWRVVNRVIAVLGYSAQEVKQAINSEFNAVKFVYQQKINGSAKAVEAALGEIKSANVFVMCADSPVWDRSVLQAMFARHLKSGADCTVLAVDVKKPQGLGRIIKDEDNNLLAVKEELILTPQEKKITQVNTGVYIFKKQALIANLAGIRKNPKKKEFFLTDIVGIMSGAGYKVKVFLQADICFFSVNTLRDLSLAQETVRRKITERLVSQGVNIIDPNTVFIAPDVKIGKYSVIYPFTFIEKNVKIGKFCSIGPFARIRPGSRIKDYAEIGNFIEIVRTVVGSKTKAKHVGYLGDAVIGREVNIGAGTVIANFDGKKKNKTIIKNEAFIGSDSILVAPVEIGKKSLTGAGSVVLKDVKSNEVVAGVPARVLKRRENAK